MIQLTLFILMLVLSTIFMQMNHPLAMSLMLLIQTKKACLMTGLMTKMFWFLYMLFLVFLGGMLVLLNEMFSFQ